MGNESVPTTDSRRDPLTGLFTELYLLERLETEFNRARRYVESLSCLCVATDDFPRLKERYGEPFSIEVLRHVGRTVATQIRGVDFVGHLGENEFVVVLPATPLQGAIRAGEKIRGRIADSRLDGPDGPLALTVSIGAASLLRRSMREKEELLETARGALREAQRQGGDRVVEMPLT